jgi:hypothetical protein
MLTAAVEARYDRGGAWRLLGPLLKHVLDKHEL